MNITEFNLPEKDFNYHNFDYVIEALGFDAYTIDLEKADSSRFKICEIYDNPHDSDESSERYLIYFDGEPCCINGYTGDSGSEFVAFFSEKQAENLRGYFLTLVRAGERTFEIYDGEDLSDQYTILREFAGELYYQLRSPKWGGYDRNKPLFAESEAGLVPIKFLRYKTKKQSWEEREGDEFIIAECECREECGVKEIEVPYDKLWQRQSL